MCRSPCPANWSASARVARRGDGWAGVLDAVLEPDRCWSHARRGRRPARISAPAAAACCSTGGRTTTWHGNPGCCATRCAGPAMPMRRSHRSARRARTSVAAWTWRCTGRGTGVAVGLHARGGPVTDLQACHVLHPELFALATALRPLLAGLEGLRRDGVAGGQSVRRRRRPAAAHGCRTQRGGPVTAGRVRARASPGTAELGAGTRPNRSRC